MALVTFHRITCRDTQEIFSDEPYLLYNGLPLAGPFNDVDEGESRDINVVRNLQGEALVELFESDFPDGDDFLASITILEDEAGQGLQIRAMKGDGARYTLYYEVE
jgi:hypothetical protein